MEGSRKILCVAAGLSMIAALVHFWAMPGHFEEWWGYGVFFLVAATVQGVYGLALLRRPRRSLFIFGIGANLAIVVLYVATRTVGVPLFGPHAGVVEQVGVLDLAATMAELALAIALVALLRFGWRPNAVDLIQGPELARTNESGQGLSRRDFLRTAGVAGALGVSGGALGLRAAGVTGALGVTGVAAGVHAGSAHGQELDAGGHEGMVGQHGGQGDVDLSRFDPSKVLRDFDWGEERQEGGRTVREYELVAQDAEIEVAPGVFYPAWTFNGQVPGPTLRAREGDLVRVTCKNAGTHPHTVHFHGIHAANIDGTF